MDSNNEIDKIFRDRLDGHESSFIPSAWDKMESMLDSAPTTGFVFKNVQRYILASVAGAIILASSVMAYISGYNTSTGTFTAQQADKSQSTEKITQNTPVTGSVNADTENAAPATNAETTMGATNTETVTAATQRETNTIPSRKQQRVSKKQAQNNVAPNSAEPSNVIENTPAAGENEQLAEEPVVEAPVATHGLQKRNYTLLTLQSQQPGNFSFAADEMQDAQLAEQKATVDSTVTAARKLREMERYYSPKFGIYGGVNFNKVMSNISASNGFGSGFLAGIFLSKNITRRWVLGAELNYMRRNGNSINRSINQTHFFFNRTVTDYSIITKSFDYVQVPLAISYRLTHRHTFSFGAAAGYMVNAQNEVVTKTQKPTESSENTQTENGVYEDLQRWSYGAWAGYEYNLPGIYTLGIRYNQNLNDLTKNSYFHDKKFLPADIQVYIKLNLSK